MVGPASERPSEFPFLFLDRVLVDTCETSLHQTIGRKFPILIAVGTEPVAAVVAVFIGIPHGNTVFGKGPELLDEPVVQFRCPFSFQKRLCLGASGRKFSAVAPFRVLGIGQSNPRRVAAVPAIFGEADVT